MCVNALLFFVVTALPLVTDATCPDGFASYGGSCYFVSNETNNFAGCQAEVCGPLNSTLATIRDLRLQKLLLDLVQADETYRPAPFIGMYKRFSAGNAGKGHEWAWIDGSSWRPFYSAWSFGEPSNMCYENCAVLSLTSNISRSGWADVACGARQRCLCHAAGNVTSPEYDAYRDSLVNLTAEDSAKCMKVLGPGGIVGCFWYGDRNLQLAFLSLGLPCGLTMLYVLVLSILGSVGARKGIGKFMVDVGNEQAASDYGQLLDVPLGGAAYCDIFQWCVRGAVGELVYAAALLTLAITVGYHIQTGYRFTFAVDTVEALVMVTSKLAVAISTLKVNSHLSPFARAVAGPWVIVLMISKFLMAVCALIFASVNLMAFDDVVFEHQLGAMNCNEGYLFVCSLIICLVLQSVSGFAIFKIQDRAMGYVEDSRVFSRVVGCHWGVLIFTTFGAGLGLGICSGLFVFDRPNDSVNPFFGIGLSFFAAGICQLISGNSMWLATMKLRDHFGKLGQRGGGDAMEMKFRNR